MDYRSIASKLKEFNLSETFPEIRRKVSSVGIWSLTEKVDNLWMTYQQMMQFMLQGLHDSQSEKIRQDICFQLEIIVSRLERFERMAKYPSDKYTQARRNLDNVPSFESIVCDMEKLALEMKKVRNDELLRESIRLHQMERLETLHESASQNLFNWIWTSELWQNTDIGQANQFIFSEHISGDDKAIFISAVTLSLFEFTDKAKLLFLLDCYLVDDDQISQRSLIGFLLAFYINFEEIKTCSDIENRLSIYRDDALFLHDVYAVMMQLQMSCTTDSVSSKIRNDIMPVLMRGAMSKRTPEQNFDANEWMKNGENPEWMLNENMNKKMHEMADLQLEGADVYYASFATLKGYSFFNQIPHWFYPFSFESIHTPELKNILNGNTGKFIKLMLNGSPFCNSDKYSLCFTFSNLGQMGEAAIEAQVSSQLPSDMDIDELSENAGLRTSKKDIRRHYIFDLYRFFHSYPYKQQFKNPFDILKENPLTPLSNPWMEELLCAQKEDLAQYADFLMRKEFYKASLQIFNILAENEFDDHLADIWQKKGFCHQKLDEKTEAIYAYTVANNIKPHSKWTLSHLAALCFSEQKMEEAAKYYKNLLEISPDNSKYLFSTSVALMQCLRFEEALPLLYKATYLDESSIVLRHLAWCLIANAKNDEAMTHILKLLASDCNDEIANVLFSIVLIIDGKMMDAYQRISPIATSSIIADFGEKLAVLCQQNRIENSTRTLFLDALQLNIN